ncbi:MAG: hypothetical protein QM778_23875 [Myxococcales bacterium]
MSRGELTARETLVRRALAALLGVLCAGLTLWWILPRGVARLEAAAGDVRRDEARAEGKFRAAHAGDAFMLGDGLKTERAATAEVQIVQGPRLKVKPSTLLRFRGRRAEGAQVLLARGSVSIFTAEEPVLFETAAGILRIAAHSRATLDRGPQQTRVEVLFGRAELEWSSAPGHALEAGEMARFVHAEGVTEFADEASKGANTPHVADARAQTPGARATDAGADAPGDAEPIPGASLGAGVTTSGPADIVLPASPFLTVLDGAAPTVIGLRSTKCQGKPTLSVERQGRFVEVGTTHAFGVGVTRYRLLCGSQLAAAGKVRVVQDAARRNLATPPPSNVIDLDGRSYRVLYQTALPEVSVRWSSAKADSESTLVVEGPHSRQTFAVRGAHFALPPASLHEGDYRLWFEQPRSNLRSRTTRLGIHFDNATPLARLNEDALLEAAADGSAHVSGAVVEGARLSVQGKRVELDDRGRFDVVVSPQPDQRAVALAVEVPARGVFYYVRRFKGEAQQ